MSDQKRGRKPTKPSLDLVFQAMDRGEYDEDLQTVIERVNNRRKVLQDAVRERVRQVFGPEADVVVPAERPNLFLEKRGRIEETPDGTRTSTQAPIVESDELPGDGLDSLSDLDAMERQMSSGDGQTTAPLDIERRGATISGLHPSDMA